MDYEHTQYGPLWLTVAATTIGLWIAAWFVPQVQMQRILLLAGGALCVVSLSFHHLTIRDEGEHLLLFFGPLPVFRRRLLYDRIERVEQARSTFLDGWGIHVSPGGGWVWNLWGFDCVDVWHSGGRKLRIGTDDPSGLAEFLKQRMSTAADSTESR